MSEGAPRELSLAEIDALSMQAIDQITARLPVREYRTPKATGPRKLMTARRAMSWSSTTGRALR